MTFNIIGAHETDINDGIHMPCQSRNYYQPVT